MNEESREVCMSGVIRRPMSSKHVWPRHFRDLYPYPVPTGKV